MRFNNLSLILIGLVALNVITPVTFANEKKAEGGEGGAAESGGKEQKEFQEKSGKLSSLANKIEEAEKHFQEIVHHKSEAKSVEEKQSLIKELVEIANQRNKDVEVYNKLKTDLLYRYPYQGEALNRRYETQNKRSVEQLEAGGLDELLTRTKKAVERKFAPLQPERVKEAHRAKAPAAETEEAPKRLRLEK